MTKLLNGASLNALSSNASDVQRAGIHRRLLYLAALGAAGVLLHVAFRWPLHLPGRFGMEWMALLTFACLTAPGRWSGTMTGAAAALIGFAPLWGFHDPLAPVAYLISGWVFDMLLLAVPQRFWSPVRLPVLAAVAFMASAFIPLLNPLHAGFAASTHSVPVFFGAHFVFGLIGGLIGTLFGTLTVRRSTR